MKKILTILLILLISQVCFAGRVQQAHKAVITAKNGAGGAAAWDIHTSGTASQSTTITINNVSAGDLIVIFAGVNITNASIVSVNDGNATDNANFVVGAYSSFGGYNGSQLIYLLSSVASGNVTYTMTLTDDDYYGYVYMVGYAITPLGTVTIDDTEAIGQFPSSYMATDWSTADITTTGTSEIVFSTCTVDDLPTTITSPTINDLAIDNSIGLTASFWDGKILLSYKIFTSTFTGNGKWTMSPASYGTVGLFSFKQ